MDYFIIAITTIAGLAFHGWLIMRFSLPPIVVTLGTLSAYRGAIFVASGGAIRGVYLESVMQQIRQDNPGLNASDEDLARAILIQDGTAAGQ